MEDNTTTEEEQVSALSMSDEEFLQMEEPVFDTEDTEDQDEIESTETQEDTEEVDTTSTDNGNTEEIEPKEEAKSEDKKEDVIDYKAEYEKLVSPFKANGVDIKVSNIDEAISLMQMGANYHKKMASLKPALKVVRLLEKNNLLDETQLSYLIDLHKKDPEAITKLVKESGIDPVDIDVSQDTKYSPKTQLVSDTEMQLDTILDTIKDTPQFTRTIHTITKEWDDASRSVIASNPHIISIINEQVHNGIFDKVNTELQRQRSFGRLTDVSDLDAYKQVGDYLHNQGLLLPKKDEVITPKKDERKEQDVQRDKLRKAASPPPAKKTPNAPSLNKSLLALSDEEFLKLPPEPYTKIK